MEDIAMATYEEMMKQPEAIRDFLFLLMRREVRAIIHESWTDHRIHHIDETTKLIQTLQASFPTQIGFYLKILAYLRSRAVAHSPKSPNQPRFRPYKDTHTKPQSTFLLESFSRLAQPV